MKISDAFLKQLLELGRLKDIYLSGDIAKHIEPENDEQKIYIEKCLEVHKKTASERFAVSQKALIQNAKLKTQQNDNQNLLIELTARNQELHNEKEKTANILTLVKKDKETVEVKLQLMESERKFDIINKALHWLLIILGTIILGSLSIYLSHLFMNKPMEVVSNQFFGIVNTILIACISMIGALLGVKRLETPKV